MLLIYSYLVKVRGDKGDLLPGINALPVAYLYNKDDQPVVIYLVDYPDIAADANPPRFTANQLLRARRMRVAPQRFNCSYNFLSVRFRDLSQLLPGRPLYKKSVAQSLSLFSISSSALPKGTGSEGTDFAAS